MNTKPKKRVIKAPDHTYQPTQAEMEEPVRLPDGNFKEAVHRILQPTEVHEVSAKEWRKRRCQGAKRVR